WLGNRPPVRTAEYFRRRLLRVLPAYWVQIAVLLLVMLAAGGWRRFACRQGCAGPGADGAQSVR
ncbi:hypothetical protein, partial [Thiolapillus sp.]